VAVTVRASVEIFVSDVDRSIAFYEALAFRVALRRGDWVLLERQGATLALQSDSHTVDGPHFFTAHMKRRPRGVGAEIRIEVVDLDAAHARAQQLEAVVDGPRDRPWRARDFRVADPDGYYLRFTTPLLERGVDDPHAREKDLAWFEIAEVDGRLDRGEIDEAGWHAEMARVVVPAYLAAETPWGGSGKSGTAEDWEYARSHIAHAIDRPGSFLDVGCANGYLLECVPRWTPHPLERYGIDISPELVAVARGRLPDLTSQLFVGNVLHWTPPHRFTYIRTGLEYVPRHRRRELVEHLLSFCDRLIIGVLNEEVEARPTEECLRSWGYAVRGRTERASRRPGIDYRVLWIDAVTG
jgi:catechol 2,3-dioxygenase-like lactoylglutathione lyase family enzyme